MTGATRILLSLTLIWLTAACNPSASEQSPPPATESEPALATPPRAVAKRVPLDEIKPEWFVADRLDASWTPLLPSPDIRPVFGWLARHKSPEDRGQWDATSFTDECRARSKCDGNGVAIATPTVNALAILTFVEAGFPPTAGRYRKLLSTAWRRVIEEQGSDGLLGDRIGPYHLSHACATMVLAYLSSGHETKKLTEPLRRAVAYLVNNQLRDSRGELQGWGSAAESRSSRISVTTWAALALAQARQAGVDVPDATFEGVVRWVRGLTDPVTAEVDAAADVTDHGLPAVHAVARSAMGLLLLDCFGQSGSSEAELMGAAARRIACSVPQVFDDRGATDVTSALFGTLALCRRGGEDWALWCSALRKSYCPLSDSMHCARGSFDPRGAWAKFGGRVYSTAMMAIGLRVLFGARRAAGVDLPPPNPQDAAPFAGPLRGEPVRQGQTRIAAYHSEPSAKFLAVWLVPPKAADTPRPHRDVIFLLGPGTPRDDLPRKVMRHFVESAIRHLGPDDAFNIIGSKRTGSCATTAFAEPRESSPDAVRHALGYIEDAAGAHWDDAYFKYLGQRRAPNRVRVVYVLTGARICAECANTRGLLSSIRSRGEDGIWHAVSIGPYPGSRFAESIASLGRGKALAIRIGTNYQSNEGNEPEQVGNLSDATAAVERFAKATIPLATDIRLELNGSSVEGTASDEIRAVYPSEPIGTLVRSETPIDARALRFRGRVGNREIIIPVVALTDAAPMSEADLSRWWARARIQFLRSRVPEQTWSEYRATTAARINRLAKKYELPEYDSEDPDADPVR